MVSLSTGVRRVVAARFPLAPHRLAFAAVCAIVSVSPAARAQAALVDFEAQLVDEWDPSFVDAVERDLSSMVTAPRNQHPTGNCVGFSDVAAIEARFNMQFCASGQPNDFRNDGYCARFDAIQAAQLPRFWWHANYSHYFSCRPALHPFGQHKEVDLSELYSLARGFSQHTAAPTSVHENISFIDWSDQQIPHAVCISPNGFRLPEEADAPFLNMIRPTDGLDPYSDWGLFWDPTNYNFWDGTRPGALGQYVGGSNFAQSKTDAIDFGDPPIASLMPGSPLTRAFVPLAARKNARFGVEDYFRGHFYVFPSPEAAQKLLERAIYGGYPVAVHGPVNGHSMLLTGYDRKQRKFYYKDHYNNWAWAPYDEIDLGDSFTIVRDVSYTPPAREEMWLGDWDLDVDGLVSRLVIRRTRQPANSHFSDNPNNFWNEPLPAMSRTKWARIGSYFTSGVSLAAYGRLGDDGDDGTMSIVIDYSTLEGPPSTIAEHEAGFSPVGLAFEMQLMSSGPGAAVYGVGSTKYGGQDYAMIMQRRGHAELVDIPHTPASFARTEWNKTFTLHFEDGSTATLSPEITWDAGGKAWFHQGGTSVQLVQDIYQENGVRFTGGGRSLELLYATGEKGVVSGTDQDGRPVIGVAE